MNILVFWVGLIFGAVLITKITSTLGLHIIISLALCSLWGWYYGRIIAFSKALIKAILSDDTKIQ